MNRFLCAGFVAASAYGQTAAPLSFETASVKPSGPLHLRPGESVGTSTGFDRVSFPYVALRYCIAYAYRVGDFQISGPAWLGDQHYDIVAKGPAGTVPKQLPEMVQTLLAERFKLQFHRESKEFAGLGLVVGKTGPKLEKAAGGCTPLISVSPPLFKGGRVEGDCSSLEMLAVNLSIVLGRPVANMTRLTGQYNFVVEVSRDDTNSGSTRPPVDGIEAGVSVFTSIEKLGLKLEARKIPLDVIVVDHVEKTPGEN
jgi:uncharacterized protein (TIGR03435 family)